MPWRREEVAPYCYREVYHPSRTARSYYSDYVRTPEQMEEAREKAEASVRKIGKNGRSEYDGPRW